MSIRPLLALVLAFCLTVVTACSGGADAVERSNITTTTFATPAKRMTVLS